MIAKEGLDARPREAWSNATETVFVRCLLAADFFTLLPPATKGMSRPSLDVIAVDPPIDDYNYNHLTAAEQGD